MLLLSLSLLKMLLVEGSLYSLPVCISNMDCNTQFVRSLLLDLVKRFIDGIYLLVDFSNLDNPEHMHPVQKEKESQIGSKRFDLNSHSGRYGFFVKFGAGYPKLESTTFRLNSSNPALPYISLFLFFNLFT